MIAAADLQDRMEVRLVLTVISSLFFSISLSCAAAVKKGLLISVNLDFKMSISS